MWCAELWVAIILFMFCIVFGGTWLIGVLWEAFDLGGEWTKMRRELRKRQLARRIKGEFDDQ